MDRGRGERLAHLSMVFGSCPGGSEGGRDRTGCETEREAGKSGRAVNDGPTSAKRKIEGEGGEEEEEGDKESVYRGRDIYSRALSLRHTHKHTRTSSSPWEFWR